MSSVITILKDKRYRSVAFVFASLNVLMGTWAIYIPNIKNKLDLNPGQLGIALFCFAAGTFSILLLASTLINKYGVGNSTKWGLIIHALSFILPFAAPSYVSLCLSLYLVGLSAGFTDIAMNTLISEYEKKEHVLIMSSAHGFFSLGGIIGAGIGSLLGLIIRDPIIHILLVVVILLILHLLSVGNYVTEKAHIDKKESQFSMNLLRPLMGLGIIGFIIMGAEGAITDWSALYLHEICHTPEHFLGLGFASFSLFMTIGRFLGDDISSQLGSTKIISYGIIVANIGIAITLSGNTSLALLGFSLIGIGLSVVVPELFRLSSQMNQKNAAQAISLIAGLGYAGFLCTPVIIGGIANLTSLKGSFVFLLIAILACGIISLFIKVKKS